MRILVPSPSSLRRIGALSLLAGLVTVMGTTGLHAQPLPVHRPGWSGRWLGGRERSQARRMAREPRLRSTCPTRQSSIR